MKACTRPGCRKVERRAVNLPRLFWGHYTTLPYVVTTSALALKADLVLAIMGASPKFIWTSAGCPCVCGHRHLASFYGLLPLLFSEINRSLRYKAARGTRPAPVTNYRQARV
jgi:hypothetical protein